MTFKCAPLPKFELPKFELPKFELPKIDLHKIDLSCILTKICELIQNCCAPPPVVTAHLGGDLFSENFDNIPGAVYDDPPGTPVFEIVDLNAAHGWVGAANTELGANNYGGIPNTSVPAVPPTFWLDTQNTPGPINISHAFNDTTAPVAGKTAVLSFDVAKQSLDYNSVHYQTAADASLEFRIDGVMVKTITAAELATPNAMTHYDVDIATYTAVGTAHTLTLVDTSPTVSVTGFAVDSIVIHDWMA